MSSKRRGLWLFAAGSVALHMAWALLVPNVQRPRTLAEPSQVVEFSIEHSPVSDRAPAAQPNMVAEVRVALKRQNSVSSKRTEPRVEVAATDLPQPSSIAQPSAAEPGTRARQSAASSPSAAPRAAAVDLSPTAAATAFARVQPADPHGKICDRPNHELADSCDTDVTESEATDQLQHSLQTAARTIPHLAKRESPQLRREANGAYHYEGEVFKAKIGLDGQVAFEDLPGVQLGPIPLMGIFDLTDTVEKYVLKREIYSAEKHWFLDQTATLRAQLADTFRAQEWSHTKLALEREFERILADQRASAPQKHAAVFALWQDCGDDAEAARIRSVVEALVRRRMPQDSALGFSSHELNAFNRAAIGRTRFEPYRIIDAGAPG